MKLYNCRVVEHNDEHKDLRFRQVEALSSFDAARVYCETDGWEDVLWKDCDEAVIEVLEIGVLGASKRVRVNACETMIFSVAGEGE